MDKEIVVNGGNRLIGKIINQTSKNAILPIIAGAILTEEVILKNAPNIVDLDNMLNILKSLGAKVEKNNKDLHIVSKDISKFEIEDSLMQKLRSSIFLLGPMLAKYKKAVITLPGGCNIGARPINIHLDGLKSLGVKISEEKDKIICDGRNMKACTIKLAFPSVGATENLIMASVLLKGKTRLLNVAKEPEIIDLVNFLNKCGCKISGAGSDFIEIEGVEKLNNIEYTPQGDRITAGSYLIAGAITRGKVEIENINPRYIEVLIQTLSKMGCEIETEENKVKLLCESRLKRVEYTKTSAYPGFPTDLQAPFMSLLAVAKGESMLEENLFENRFHHVDELNKMGASITVRDKLAKIKGVNHLTGGNVEAKDLRGGASLVLAGLNANGKTKIKNIGHILRGYEDIDHTLSNLGADIKIIK